MNKLLVLLVMICILSTIFLNGCTTPEKNKGEPPIPGFSYEPSDAWIQDIVTFHSTSFDIDGTIINWTWNLGDGTIKYGETITYQYNKNDTYTVKLKIKDNEGNIRYIERKISIDSFPALETISLNIDDLPEGYGKFSEDDNASFLFFYGINSSDHVFNIYGETYLYQDSNNDSGFPMILLALCRFNSSKDAKEEITHFSNQTLHTFNKTLPIVPIQDKRKLGNESIYKLHQGLLGEEYGYKNATWLFIYFRIENILVLLLLNEMPSSNVDYINLSYQYATIIEERINDIFQE